MTGESNDVSRSLAAARAGSQEALGRMLETYRRYLLAVAGHGMDADLQRKGGASDLVQQTFLEAQRDFAHFQGETEAELQGWLRRILEHNLANFQRHYKRTAKRDVFREVPVESERSSRDWKHLLVADSATPSQHAMAHELSAVLLQALGRLPEDYRQVIELRYGQGLDFPQIAKQLERSEAAVRKLWARAVKRLQQEMGGHRGT